MRGVVVIVACTVFACLAVRAAGEEQQPKSPPTTAPAPGTAPAETPAAETTEELPTLEATPEAAAGRSREGPR
jgi:hypothetical protein